MEEKEEKMKILIALIGFILIIGIALTLDLFAKKQSTYQGLPTVPCLDYTKPIVQNFVMTIGITIDGKKYPLNPTIGHDYGNCLHDIFVHDASGRVYVEANEQQTFTLGQFFDVWHKTFSQNQIFNYQVDQMHRIQVFVNNKLVSSYRETILKSNETIHIIYE